MVYTEALKLKGKIEAAFRREGVTKVKAKILNYQGKGGEEDAFYVSVARRVFGVRQECIVDSFDSLERACKIAFSGQNFTLWSAL